MPGRPDDTWGLAFVAGSPRCGSTLVGNALGSAPGAAHLGELAFLWSPRAFERPGHRCGCGQLLAECPMWRGVLAGVVGGGTDEVPPALVGLARRARDVQQGILRQPSRWAHLARPRGVLRADERWYAGLLAEVLGGVAAATGATTLIDSTKFVPHLLLLARVRNEVDVVHLVRDPRGVVRSRQRDGAGATSDLRVAVVDSARWVGNTLGVQLARRHPGLRVAAWRYEDFARSPGPVLAQMAGHLGAEVPPTAPDGTVTVEINHTAWGNKHARFTTGEVPVRTDDRWRRELRPPGRWIAGAAAPLVGVALAAGGRRTGG